MKKQLKKQLEELKELDTLKEKLKDNEVDDVICTVEYNILNLSTGIDVVEKQVMENLNKIFSYSKIMAYLSDAKPLHKRLLVKFPINQFFSCIQHIENKLTKEESNIIYPDILCVDILSKDLECKKVFKEIIILCGGRVDEGQFIKIGIHDITNPFIYNYLYELITNEYNNTISKLEYYNKQLNVLKDTKDFLDSKRNLGDFLKDLTL